MAVGSGCKCTMEISMAKRLYFPEGYELMSETGQRAGLTFVGMKYCMANDPAFPKVLRIDGCYLLEREAAAAWVKARLAARAARPGTTRAKVISLERTVTELRLMLAQMNAKFEMRLAA